MKNNGAVPLQKPVYEDVLASRYATPEMVLIWDPVSKIITERKLWTAAIEVQRELGLPIPKKAVRAYKRAITNVNLASLRERELITKQDIKAKEDEFNDLAGFKLCHRPFTSRDLTDNIEQFQILSALRLIRFRAVAVLDRFKRKALEFQMRDLCGRSHIVVGQTITFGKRFANFAEELMVALKRLDHLISIYPLRGFKGPMGTQQDLVHLLGGKHATEFERRMRDHLGFRQMFTSVGQVYPRSLDYAVVSELFGLAGAIANFAKMIRLMSGQDLAHEGFTEGSTGSTGMPHKVNNRTSERISGLLGVLAGYVRMLEHLVGDQWYEGDVSCSVVRRVALPGAFFAMDSMIESALHVLDKMEVFPHMIEYELNKYLPFLATTAILVEATTAGLDKPTAHRIIKEHARSALQGMRCGQGNSFLDDLAEDREFPLGKRVYKIAKVINHGRSPHQVAKVCQKINTIVRRCPEAANYKPYPIL